MNFQNNKNWQSNTPIHSPVSIRKLRQVKSSKFACHIVFAKIMTFWKIIANLLTLCFSGYWLAIRLLNGAQQIGIIYSSIYAGLAFVDLIICIVTFKKLVLYQTLQQINPNSAYLVKVKGLDFLKWCFITIFIFYAFISTSFIFNVRQFHFTSILTLEVNVVASLVYIGIGALHLISILVFRKRQNHRYQIQMEYLNLNDTVLLLDSQVYDQKVV